MTKQMWIITCRMIKIAKTDGAQTEELLGFSFKGELEEALLILAARSEIENEKSESKESVYYAVVAISHVPRLSDAAIAGAHMEQIEYLTPPGYGVRT